jgi:flavodoxin
MNTLIVYDSTFGNTRQLALKMAEVFQEYGYVHPIPVAEASHINEADWDLLLIGGPTQLHKISPALNALVRSIPRRALRGRYAATFDTRYQQARWLTGSAASRLARQLRRAGAKLLLPPESFFVTAREGPLIEGEAQRAAMWARILIDCFRREERLKQSNPRSALV